MAVERLVDRVGHWSPDRWARPPTTPEPTTPEPTTPSPPIMLAGGSRADLVFGLAQYLADVAAVAEGQPRRPVPRLEHDAALTDQIRVLAEDLIRAPAPDAVLAEAVNAIRATTRSV